MESGSDAPELLGFTGGMLATNSYAFRAADGWIAVDAPEGAAAWLESQGIAPSVLLLTHQHFDHVLGAAELVDRFNCPVWAFCDYDTGLTLETFFSGFTGTSFEVKPFEVGRSLAETAPGEVVEVAGTEMRILHIPGHSPDSICFVQEDEGLIFGGDVLFQSGLGRTDFPGGDQAQLVGGIHEKLFPLGDRFHVLPGHGPTTTLGAERTGNPFL